MQNQWITLNNQFKVILYYFGVKSLSGLTADQCKELSWHRPVFDSSLLIWSVGHIDWGGGGKNHNVTWIQRYRFQGKARSPNWNVLLKNKKVNTSCDLPINRKLKIICKVRFTEKCSFILAFALISLKLLIHIASMFSVKCTCPLSFGLNTGIAFCVIGGEGEFVLLGLGCLETEYRHLVSDPQRYHVLIWARSIYWLGIQLQLYGLANAVRSLEIVLGLEISILS